MKPVKIEEYENENGIFEKRTQSNGVSVIIHKKPSDKFKERRKKIAIEAKRLQEEKNKKRLLEKEIQKEMRQQAIDKLKEKGIIDDTGKIKEV